MRKKVLSIDMDYIMAPCINLYNDCIGTEDFEDSNLWEKLNILRGIDAHLCYDEQKLMFVVDLLTSQLKSIPKENILFAEEHDMILELLCTEDKKEEKFEIYNVDHHHDIYYNPIQKSEVDRFDFACLANWVYYLGKNDKIYKYYWVRNENSRPFLEDEITDLMFPFDADKYVHTPQDLIREKFDYIFVCRSSEYFPEKFNYLFDTLKIIASNYYDHNFDVWDKPYCIDGKTRHVPA